MLIDNADLTLRDFRAALAGPVRVELDGSARAALTRGRETVLSLLSRGAPVYGVNTGFGQLARQRIDSGDLVTLQKNIVRSHAAGTGKPLDDAIVRLVLLLKVKSLARGHSGVRPEVVDALLSLLAADVLPVVPRQGSVGASGDLAPLAHLSLVLIGEGRARSDGELLDGAIAIARAGVTPLEPGPKEGLALLNGTQVSTALALSGLVEAERNLRAAVVAGALSVDAVLGSDAPFDPRIHALRGHEAQSLLASHYRRLLAGSAIRASHAECDRVQDPYSFRCQPQVMGACLDQLRHAARLLVVEANAVTDNPLVFPEDGAVLSGGNFHAEPVAFAADGMALAIAECGALSERRIAAMIDASLSQLPPFLTPEPGLNSGYMLAQVTAAALASENKTLAHPSSTDSMPTSANQEDHVSMATHAAWRLRAMNENTRLIVAIELLAAAEGIDFRRPLESSESLEEAHAVIRSQVPKRERDREFARDIEAVSQLIAGDAFAPFVESLLD